MAIRALRAVVRQTEPSVVERSAQPVVHVVARQACLRIIQCYVIRNARASQVGRALIVRFVAAVAVRWDGGEIVVYVAACARNSEVSADQRENSFAVIESCAGPTRRTVACIARQRESGLNVIWICRAVVVRHVARFAARIIQRVVVVDMA